MVERGWRWLAGAALMVMPQAVAQACEAPPVQAGGISNADTRAIEHGIWPARILEDTRPQTLAERMAALHVPGVSVAVIRRGRIAWARGWGVRDSERCTPMDADTILQAASISKPVFAALVMRLSDMRELGVDADVDSYLRRWHLPAAPAVSAAPVTLRQLLSHTAGLTLHGFPGYAPDERIPDLAEILGGEPIPRAYLSMVPPGTTRADGLVREAAPGARWQYSGGGYLLAQMAVEDRLGQPLEQLAQRLVFRPLRMRHSSFAQPAPAALVAQAASGHADAGRLPGGHNVYPHQAAGGLWTTPSDVARLMIDVRAAARGQRARLLRHASAEPMVTPGLGQWGVGFSVVGDGGERRIEHGGANAGFRNWATLFLDSGDGVIVMTNSDAGGQLADDIIRAVATHYGWPALGSQRLMDAAGTASILPRLVGDYTADGVGWQVRQVGGHLYTRAASPVAERMVMLSPTRFQLAESGLQGEFRFAADGSAPASAILLSAGGASRTLNRSSGGGPAIAMAPVYLRGSMYDWGTATALQSAGEGVLVADVMLAAGDHQFKIGSDDWTLVDLGGESGEPLTIGAPPRALGRGGANLRLMGLAAGRYRVTVQFGATGGATIAVARSD